MVVQGDIVSRKKEHEILLLVIIKIIIMNPISSCIAWSTSTTDHRIRATQATPCISGVQVKAVTTKFDNKSDEGHS